MLSIPLKLRLFSALFLLSSLLGAIAAPVGDTTGQLEQRMDRTQPKPIYSELWLIRQNSKNQQMMETNDPVRIDEIWSLRIGDAEFRAVPMGKPALKWKGLPVSLPSRQEGIRLGHAILSTAEIWNNAESQLRAIEADSNLLYIEQILQRLLQWNMIDNEDLHLWKYWNYNSMIKPEEAVKSPEWSLQLRKGFVGFYWQMLGVGGDAAGGKMKTPQHNK
ncbi:hypothetical protein F5879DRAFT_922843 [Lentinula edodes]|nr:hypothetical protein F5879DRAFT_922843 [Lentinula edodes]